MSEPSPYSEAAIIEYSPPIASSVLRTNLGSTLANRSPTVTRFV